MRVTVSDVRHRFDRPVLCGVDLDVDSGEVSAILGASGSGKSTLLRCIAGLVRPDTGQIRVGDRTVVGPGVWVPAQRRSVGLVPQEGALFPHLSVAENVGYGLRGRDRGRRVDELLELVGLPGTARMRPHELSGGMQQRVAVARALAPRPAVILLDEPFSALDAGLRDGVRSDVFGAIRADGATALLVTHDRQEAFVVADRVAVMRNGAIAQYASAWDLYRNPVSLDVAAFVGETVMVPATDAEPDLSGPPGEATLVFRPEDLNFAAGRLLGEGTVTGIRFQGHDSLTTVDVAGHDLRVRTLGGPAVRVGQRTRVYASTPGLLFPR